MLAPDYAACFRYTANDPGAQDWSQVPYRGKPAADAPRYKDIGNSVAMPRLRWPGARLLQHLS